MADEIRIKTWPSSTNILRASLKGILERTKPSPVRSLCRLRLSQSSQKHTKKPLLQYLRSSSRLDERLPDRLAVADVNGIREHTDLSRSSRCFCHCPTESDYLNLMLEFGSLEEVVPSKPCSINANYSDYTIRGHGREFPETTTIPMRD